MFECNDKVIYPGHGVAIIREIIEKLVGGSKVKFLKLDFLYKDMTILVPTYNMNAIGLRRPSDKKTLEKVIEELQRKPVRQLKGIDFTPSGWNRRNKEYQIKIQNGDILEVAKIYRDLMYISLQKDLSFGERSLLQNTEDLIVQELQVVENEDKEVVVQRIRNPFKQLMFHEKNFIQGSVPVATTTS